MWQSCYKLHPKCSKNTRGRLTPRAVEGVVSTHRTQRLRSNRNRAVRRRSLPCQSAARSRTSGCRGESGCTVEGVVSTHRTLAFKSVARFCAKGFQSAARQ